MNKFPVRETEEEEKPNELVHDWKKEDDEEIDYEDENVARTANRATYSLMYFMKYKINS